MIHPYPTQSLPMRAFFLFLLCGLGSLHAAAPVVSNISAAQRANSRLVDITYDVAADFPTVSVSLQVSSDGGSTFSVPATTLSGAIGAGVTTGTAKKITWDAGKDWSGQHSTQMRFKVIADDGNSAAASFVVIPAGAFTMGNSVAGDTDITEAPIRTVTLDSFYMGKYEVTKAEWDAVRTWGLSSGYTDLAVGSGKASNHPVQSINWYQMIKWCNARSQKEGLTPVYYINDAQTTIYKTGSVDVTNAQVRWTANGYRLPTEAEWEKAARGGLSGKRFPWGDTISHSQANYYAYDGYNYDSSGSVNNYHPSYATGSMPYTSPVGAFVANGYGLYDMAGNVWEQCWDVYGTYDENSLDNPRGYNTTQATHRVLRGGGWIYISNSCRVAFRFFTHPADSNNVSFGFRVVRSSTGDDLNTEPTISDIAAQAINEGGNTGALAFTIGDAQTAAGSLTLSGSSSDATLVPNANIVFGGSGDNRTVTVTPSSGQAGTATITVTVSDGSLSTSDTFLLTVNSAPTISDIAALMVNEGSSTSALAFTVGDVQTAASSLTLSASSSNTTLVPNANIALGGSGANRTVTVTPASGQSGTATITLTVNDGSLSASDTFVLTVNAAPANTAPTISDIAAQTITAGSSTGALAFTIGDAQTAASSLTLSISSSNTTLVPSANIVLGGSGANRTVTVTPASGQSGTATITLTVNDGSLSASDTFVLTVNAAPANTAPTISDIAAQTITAGSSTGALAFTIGDAQTAASSLTLSISSSNTTLVPSANIVLGGSGANRTVTVTPASGQNGTATITVTVSDGSLSASDTFVLTVNSAAPSGFALIPPGSFTMGNSVAEDTDITDAPTRVVTLDAYYMGKYEVTKAEWDNVRTWGLSNGYTDLATGADSDRAINLPVHTISWYQVVKWCNARSQNEGYEPVYYTNNALTTVYKTGDVDITNAQVKWTANGYRLPTEAEWEKASRGGLNGKRFPWGDTISHTLANYFALASYSYDLSGFRNSYHPSYIFGFRAYTSPVGTFKENSYGLYDMAGNVEEWCWDRYGAYNIESQSNPRGFSSAGGYSVSPSFYRVLRGGCWSGMATLCRTAHRSYDIPSDKNFGVGFRVARNAAPDYANSAPTISDIAAQSINQGDNTGALAFTVADDQTTASTLTLSASSSNTTLVPDANIVLGGSGANRTVTVIPASGQTGTATITLTVSDGWLTSSDNFVVMVNSSPSVNTAPTISDIAAQTINQGGNTGAIAFTVGDSQTAASSLTLSVSSSNTTLVPNANIVFGGSGANRTVTVTPASGQTGTVTITVNVSDGSLSSSDNFVMMVNSSPSVNTAPTISDIAAQTINQGGNTGAIAFTVGDSQTAASSLTLSVSSSNTTLVPNANIVFGGSGANRTVTVTPASGQTGTVMITVNVSDGSLSSSDTFVMTVNSLPSVNTAPTISDISAQSITAGSNTGALAFTIGDAQTAASSLTLNNTSSNTTIVPNANIVFGGSGANRTVRVTPANGQTGTATITVTVSDGSLSTSDTFVLTVKSASAPDLARFALISSGSFTMGSGGAFVDSDIFDAPSRSVTLDAFYIGKYEVTKAEWDEVRIWAASNGYTDLAAGSGKASNHPVESIKWYDMVKWCNARSEKEGLTPVYFTNDAQTTIYKTGSVDITNNQVKWSANGYRLPTEAEWEKAARGGLSGKRFPWGDTISHSQSNYTAWSIFTYDLSGTASVSPHPSYSIDSIGGSSHTSPVGVFKENGFGLYDMAGNVWERCWDRYGTYTPGSQTNPRGATLGTTRVVRGGCHSDSANRCRVAARANTSPAGADDSTGFRIARRSAP